MSDVKVNVESLENADAWELSRELEPVEPGVEIRFYMLLEESAHPNEKLYDIILSYGPQVAGAIVAGVLAALKEKIKAWLLKKKECKHRKIPIYGPDGEVVVVVECEIKNHSEN